MKLQITKNLYANLAGAKTITFAIVHFCVAFSVAYAITGSVALGGLIALVEPLCNTIAYYFHEKSWGFINNYRTNSNNRTIVAG